MGKVKGVTVKVKVDGNFVAGERNATLNRSAETIDITTKDSAGWKENDPGYKEWGVDSDGLLTDGDAGFEALETAYMNGTPVALDISLPSGKKYTGNALITDFPLEAPYDDEMTYSVSFVGTGALTVTPAAGE